MDYSISVVGSLWDLALEKVADKPYSRIGSIISLGATVFSLAEVAGRLGIAIITTLPVSLSTLAAIVSREITGKELSGAEAFLEFYLDNINGIVDQEDGALVTIKDSFITIFLFAKEGVHKRAW